MAEAGLAVFAAAVVLAAALTPLARRLALAANLVAPVRADRAHQSERPYGGGLALADAMTLVLVVAWLMVTGRVASPIALPADMAARAAEWTPVLLRLAVGAAMFLAIGLADDWREIPAAPKLALQLVAAAAVTGVMGIRATVWLDAQWASIAVSTLWIVAVINAYNMLDHADGLAAAVGAAALVALAAGLGMAGEWFVPLVALAAGGALVGFLMHNFPPSRLFMGDAGSHLVGFLLAALTMLGGYWREGANLSRAVVLAPLVLLAVPLADMALVTAGRVARGQSPMKGDATSHFAHRLAARGWSPRAIVLAAAALAAVAGGAFVLMLHSRAGLSLAALAVFVIVAALAFARPKKTEGAP
jgi:UDP-GlcNAc:undecaprenyl-phosphate GlcNAc-1-phosphate transferase